MITLSQLVYDGGLEKVTKVMVKNINGFVMEDTIIKNIPDRLLHFEVYDIKIRDNTLIIKLDTDRK